MERMMDRAGNFLPRVDETSLTPGYVDRRLVTLTAPASPAAEVYRTLYYRLERLREMRPMKLIAFTSAVAGEGKTVTAVNLALTAARANLGKRILLIDGDLRRSRVGEVLSIKSKPGLTELLAGECQVADAVRRFQSSRLAVLPAGGSPEEPTQLLAGQGMRELLASVRENFDEVYLDLPPALPFADAGILATQSDGIVMVIRANMTPARQVSQALEHLAGAPIMGCVLNGAQLSAAPYLKAYTR